MNERNNYPNIEEKTIHLSDGVNPDWVIERFRANTVPLRYDNSTDYAIREWFYRVIVERGIKSVLDVGCGKGRDSVGIQNAGATYHGLDPIPDNILFAKERWGADRFTQGYVQEIPFPDDSFNCVWMMSVWESTPKNTMKQAITECLRVSNRYVINVDAGHPPLQLRERWGYIPSDWSITLDRLHDEKTDSYYTIWFLYRHRRHQIHRDSYNI